MKLMALLRECDREKLNKISEELDLLWAPGDTMSKLREMISETLLKREVVAARLAVLTDAQMSLFERACEGMFMPDVGELDDTFAVFKTFCAFRHENEETERDKNPVGFLNLWREFSSNPKMETGLKLAGEFQKITKFYFVVPDEIAAVYRELDTPEFHEARHTLSWLTRCVVACGRLYAVTPVSVLLEVYARKEPIEEEKLHRLVQAYSGAANGAVYDSDGDRMLRWPMSKEKIQEILDRQGNRDFYIPEPEEVELLYVNEHVSELPAYENLELFLMEYCGAESWDAYDAAREFWDVLAEGDDGPQEALQWLIDLTDAGEKILPLLGAFYRNCRLCTRCVWYRGHTWKEALGSGDEPDDLTGNMRLKFSVSPRNIRISRNAPCPCGSGKKYKKCCGG